MNGTVETAASVLTAPSVPGQRPGDGAGFAPSGRSIAVVISPEAGSARELAAMVGDLCHGNAAMATAWEQALLEPPAELAVVDLRFGSEALDIVAELRLRGWHRVLVVAATTDTDIAAAAMARGATGIVVTHQHEGARSTSRDLDHALSDREIEVIGMVADGRPNKWIGEQLGLSSLTVKSHLARIGRKLGTGDRARIVQLALQAGIIR